MTGEIPNTRAIPHIEMRGGPNKTIGHHRMEGGNFTMGRIIEDPKIGTIGIDHRMRNVNIEAHHMNIETKGDPCKTIGTIEIRNTIDQGIEAPCRNIDMIMGEARRRETTGQMNEAQFPPITIMLL